MAVSGFEGFEKRLELRFTSTTNTDSFGLRLISISELESILDRVQCTIVSAVGNPWFDSYVLSESSLFIYPDQVIIKTCGTTRLLRSVRSLLTLASKLGLVPHSCRYTRGTFIFPKSQPFPHTSFDDEVRFLNECLPSSLCHRKSCVMASKWHVYSASSNSESSNNMLFTMEVCMTHLDRVVAEKFFRNPVEVAQPINELYGQEMTRSTGIRKINPGWLVCDYGFDPCGYSMNGLGESLYSTVHVTPEEGHSYASFECAGWTDDMDGICETLMRVACVFRPGSMSVSVVHNGGGGGSWRGNVSDALVTVGLGRREWETEMMPGIGTINFMVFEERWQ
ncbi:S-adenosylmethionine decarboxylase proenzyme [Acorus gramineus]|uniref:S-adenosylmethionine decarboxylase proenzyme n=1 Tax=Acorus gramineus TaxID=55184 RepID=A0AAV9A1W2_ACOGR|nr:S-adenosylmethionine decarboxylase proenzyme [Acorus gramineus]